MNATEKLELLRLGYLRSLDSKAVEIADGWRRVLESDFDFSALCELKTLVHRIAGSAGMYGLDDVSASAHHVDDQLSRAGDADATRRTDLDRRVNELLDLMQRARE